MTGRTRLMGIDPGQKRIGVALGDPLGIIATPLEVVKATPKREAYARLETLVAQHEIALVVVGLPTTSEGYVGEQARKVISWARGLAKVIDAPILMWDESHSSEQAAALTAHKRGKRARQQQLDAVAAAVILQSYLEVRTASYEPGSALQSFDAET